MRRNKDVFIIIVFSLALIGMLFSQWLWINKSYELKKEQFDHRVDMALSDVVDEFKRYRDTTQNVKVILNEKLNKCPVTILDIAKPILLDTLLSHQSSV